MNRRTSRTKSEASDSGSITVDAHFTQLPDWLLEHTGVSDRALRIWLILMSHARSKETKVAWLGRRKLAERCKCSIDSVDRAIKELRDVGALSVVPRLRPDDNGQTSNDYTLHTRPHPCGPPAAPTRPPSAAPTRRPPGHGRGSPLGTGAAPRERALDGEHLSSSLSRSPAATADTPDRDPQVLFDVSSSTPVPIARALPGDWTPNHTHAVVAAEHGLDLIELVDDFRATRAARVEKRSNWDTTFAAYVRDVTEGRSRQWPST